MRANEWTLLAEGGAHIVLQPTTESEFVGRVLRLRKRPRAGRAEHARDEQVALDFARLVVEPSLSVELCARLEAMSVTAEFLRAVAARVEDQRSAERRAVDEVDDTRSTAVLADNLVGAQPGQSVVSIEIKARLAALAPTDAVSPNGASSRLRSTSRPRRAPSRPRTAASACTTTSVPRGPLLSTVTARSTSTRRILIESGARSRRCGIDGPTRRAPRTTCASSSTGDSCSRARCAVLDGPP